MHARGCVTVGPDFKKPDVTLEDRWLETLPGSSRAASVDEAAWWQAFNDPLLSALEQRAFERNLSIQIAGLHILRARSELQLSARELLPQTGGASVGAARIDHGGVGPFDADHLWAEHARFTASWEIDFWGKYRRQVESNQAQLGASRAAYDNALVSLFGDVASAYIDLRAVEQRLVVAQNNLRSLNQSLDLTRARLKHGAASELDVAQAATLVAETESQIPALTKARAQDRDTLAVLLADTPASIDALLGNTAVVPVAPTQIDVGIPADLLRRRPDIRQAALNAAAQSALIGAAKAQLYPALSLTGLFGLSSNDQQGHAAGMLASKTIGVFSAGLTLPIFTRAQIKNTVRVQDAAFQEAVLDYQNTVLQAQREVEDAIAAVSTSQDALTKSAHAVDLSRRALELANMQYRAGSVTYETVLDAARAALRDADTLAQNQGLASQAVVSLYRALGGGWQVAEDQPTLSRRMSEEMSQRTDWGRLLDPHAQSPIAGNGGEKIEPGKY